MLNPDLGADDTSSEDSNFPPPDSVVFESIAGELRQSTASPEWLDRVKSAGGSASSITDHLPYLESFLPEAMRFWDEARDGKLVSDFWTQTDASGGKIHLLACALAVEGKRLLLIRSVDDLYHESERAQQHAHASVKQLKLAALWQRGLEKLAGAPTGSDPRPSDIGTTDALTGISNRQRFEEIFEHELLAANKEDGPLSLLYLDIDQFQLINDQYGRPAGDAYLRSIGQLLEGVLRKPKDVAARVGGEEFATLLPGTDGTEAVRLAHTLGGMIRTLRVPDPISRGLLSATVSIGVFTRPSKSEQTAAQMLGAVESAVREAKRNGRGRIAIADHTI
jgi:diguanylate cyclase (GGDEF)-like protein